MLSNYKIPQPGHCPGKGLFFYLLTLSLPMWMDASIGHLRVILTVYKRDSGAAKRMRRPLLTRGTRTSTRFFQPTSTGTMWKAAALAVGLLMALVGPSQATEGNPIYGVKLCGREFIRAVIFTCGGSRWKRSLGMPGELENEPLSHDTDSTGRWNSAYKQHLEAEAEAWRGEGEDGGVFSRQARSLISEEVLEALRTSDRKGRDVVVGLSNACCKWGCSKSEISSLC